MSGWLELVCPTTWACLFKVRPGVLSKTLSHMWGKLNLQIFLLKVELCILINIDSLIFLTGSGSPMTVSASPQAVRASNSSQVNSAGFQLGTHSKADSTVSQAVNNAPQLGTTTPARDECRQYRHSNPGWQHFLPGSQLSPGR